MPPEKYCPPNAIFATDSCLYGCGGWANGKAFHTEFPDWITEQQDVSINELELLAVIIAIKKWRKQVENMNILAFCDNSVTVSIINSGAARNKFAQAGLRELCYVLAKSNAMLRMIHLPGKKNEICDALSRWREEGARKNFYRLTNNAKVTFELIKEEDFEFSHDW